MSLANHRCTLYTRVAKIVRARDPHEQKSGGYSVPECPECPRVHHILVGIPSSGDSVQWGFRVSKYS